MIEYETYTYNGDCPYTNSKQTISIIYGKIAMSKIGTGYRKTSFTLHKLSPPSYPTWATMQKF